VPENIYDSIIKLLPEISMYFIPGAVFLTLFNFIVSKDVLDKQYFVFKSIVISYIIIGIADFIISLCVPYLVIVGIISIVGGYFCGKLYHSSVLEWLLGLFRINKTVNDNFWEDINDFNKGTFITAYSKVDDKIYQGSIFKIENKQRNPYIMIYDYEVYEGSKKEENLIEKSEFGKIENIVLNPDDMKSIYVTYSDDSKKIK